MAEFCKSFIYHPDSIYYLSIKLKRAFSNNFCKRLKTSYSNLLLSINFDYIPRAERVVTSAG